MGSRTSVISIEPLGYHIVQLARPSEGWDQISELNARVRAACEELTRQGTHVSLLRSIFVPEDEAYFHLYRAVSARAVRRAARQAGLDYARVATSAAAQRGPRQGIMPSR